MLRLTAPCRSLGENVLLFTSSELLNVLSIIRSPENLNTTVYNDGRHLVVRVVLRE